MLKQDYSSTFHFRNQPKYFQLIAILGCNVVAFRCDAMPLDVALLQNQTRKIRTRTSLLNCVTHSTATACLLHRFTCDLAHVHQKSLPLNWTISKTEARNFLEWSIINYWLTVAYWNLLEPKTRTTQQHNRSCRRPKRSHRWWRQQ